MFDTDPFDLITCFLSLNIGVSLEPLTWVERLITLPLSSVVSSILPFLPVSLNSIPEVVSSSSLVWFWLNNLEGVPK